MTTRCTPIPRCVGMSVLGGFKSSGAGTAQSSSRSQAFAAQSGRGVPGIHRDLHSSGGELDGGTGLGFYVPTLGDWGITSNGPYLLEIFHIPNKKFVGFFFVIGITGHRNQPLGQLDCGSRFGSYSFLQTAT